MDVGWSAVHPALFASADLTEKLSFWNLNTDTEVIIIFSCFIILYMNDFYKDISLKGLVVLTWYLCPTELRL